MRKAAGTKRSKASKPRLAVAGRRRIELPAGCTLRDAAALKTLLAGSACTGGTVTLVGGAVTRIDTAGLQLLAAFALREQSAGRQLQWHSASAELRAASARIGLSALLQLPPGDAT